MTVPPHVLISVLAFHSAATSPAAVASALASRYDGRIDVVVREQGNDDAEYEALRAAARGGEGSGRSATVERGPNLGFAAGHNRAIARSNAPVIVLLNADAWLDDRFVASAVAALADPAVGAVQGKLLRPDGATIDSTGLVALRTRLFLNRGQGEPDDGRFDVPGEVFGPDGAAAVYRRAALEDVAVGAEILDETFFAYKCDVDLAWRLRWRGWRTAYVPGAVARHGRTMRRDVAGGVRTVLAQRRAGPAAMRELSFCNQRLMQIKNESLGGLVRHGTPWLVREVAAWGFFLATEPGRFRAVARMARLAPTAYRKRRIILRRRAPGADPYRWFGPRSSSVKVRPMSSQA